MQYHRRLVREQMPRQQLPYGLDLGGLSCTQQRLIACKIVANGGRRDAAFAHRMADLI
jgi:hypothetical protein